MPQVKVPVIADPAGRLIWAPSPARRAARQRRAREHGIVEAINTAGAQAVADPAYQGGGPAVRVRQVAVAGIPTPPLPAAVPHSAGVNTAQAHRRGPGERANAELKGWKILRKIRASPSRTTTLVQPAQPLILVG